MMVGPMIDFEGNVRGIVQLFNKKVFGDGTDEI